MPKELTYGESWQRPDSDEYEVPVVDVRWNRDQLVQIVTRVVDKEIPPPEEQEAGAWSCVYGYHVTLNRAAINKLIRDLRRARDQAYGRDE